MTAIATGYVYPLKSGPYVKIGMTNTSANAQRHSAQPPFFTDLLAYFGFWMLTRPRRSCIDSTPVIGFMGSGFG